ncbi:MAG: saccharopine dehydrogenase [Gemmatimonadetes bacterium]|nr:saccharopine dehydrogenase [Gemmatimonadota bacterium]
MHLLVLGAGLQGAACAYDLLQQSSLTRVTRVTLADHDLAKAPAFLDRCKSDPRLTLLPLDARDHAAVRAAMDGVQAVMCALPYYFNLPMTQLAIEAGAHFSDLGGNTQIVMDQKALDAAARAKGVSVVPDCGLAPGMVNVLAQMGIARCDSVESVRIYVGGLPQQPTGVLKYQVVYSLEGVLDYYTTQSWVVRDGKQTQVTALSEVEPVTFDAPVGTLEAFHTAGGLSTMAFRYEGKIPSMEYKTLRYPGHAQLMSAIRELGFLDSEPVEVKGQSVVPRDVTIAVMKPRLTKPQGKDLVALRVVVKGVSGGKPVRHEWELVDRYDEARGISAMERTTGYSLAITGLMQVGGEIGAGVSTPDEAVPGDSYVGELAKRGVAIRYSASPATG